MHAQEAGTIAVIMYFLATMAVVELNIVPQNTARETPATPHTVATRVSIEAPPIASSPELATEKAIVTTSSTAPTALAAAATEALPKKTATPVATSTKEGMIVSRPSSFYSAPPLSVDSINSTARAAIVNIYCASRDGSFSPVTGSGITLSADGVILTNAHVAQYVFLGEAGIADLTCTARGGSPAKHIGTLKTVYIPLSWVKANARLITSNRPTGTGEHDFALLMLKETPPTSLSIVTPDVREKAAFEGDQVLLASYPAEFLGALVTQSDLYSVSSVTKVTKLITFQGKNVDAFALGSVIGAQGGSSGGAVVNGWARLVGLITTTSAGATTADRELHAVSLFHVEHSLITETGKTLNEWVSSATSYSRNFLVTSAIPIIDEYREALK